MTVRKKRGLVTIISGIIFIGVGAVVYTTTVTPDWVPLIVQGIGAIANLVGFVLVFPDTD